MTKKISMKTKICLVGEPAVGKTSTIGRYVLNKFDDAYVATLQARFSKKETFISIPERGLEVEMSMILWDIMGDKGSRQLLKEAYFYRAQGILAVCDITRRSSLEDLRSWWRTVSGTVGEIPWVLVVNKIDLRGRFTYGENKILRISELLKAPHLFTSAKTGERVEEAFRILGRRIVERERVEGHDQSERVVTQSLPADRG